MFETEGLQMEGQRISLTAGFLLKRQGVMNRPFIRQKEELPFSAALGPSVVMTLYLLTALMIEGRLPEDLGKWYGGHEDRLRRSVEEQFGRNDDQYYHQRVTY